MGRQGRIDPNQTENIRERTTTIFHRVTYFLLLC